MKQEMIFKALNATIIAVIAIIAVSSCTPTNNKYAKLVAIKYVAKTSINDCVSQWELLNNPDEKFRPSPEDAAYRWMGNYFEYNDKEDYESISGLLEDYKDMLGDMQIGHSFNVKLSTMPKHKHDSVYEIEGTLTREPKNTDGFIKDLPVTFRFVFQGMVEDVQIVGININTGGSLKPVITKGIKETGTIDMASIRQKVTSWFGTVSSWFNTAIYNIKNLHTKTMSVLQLNLPAKEMLKFLFYFLLALGAYFIALLLIARVWMNTIDKIIPAKCSKFIGRIYFIFSGCSLGGVMFYILAPKTVVITTTIYVMAVALVFFFVWTIIDKILQIRREKKAKLLRYR